MSLEQSIDRLADAINASTAATLEFINRATGLAGAAAQADVAPVKRGPGRPKKEDTTPALTTPPSVDATNAAADGTTFWHNTKHDAVYRIVPGDGSSPIANSVQISEADFLTNQTRINARIAAIPGMQATAASEQAAAVSPLTAAAEPVVASVASVPISSDFPTARAALLNLAKARDDGRALVLAILKKHGVNSVPELASKTPDALGAVVAEATGALQ